MKVRPICASDNKPLSQVLRTVLLEMGVPKIGTAYADPELDKLFETYQNENMHYYVLKQKQRNRKNIFGETFSQFDVMIIILMRHYYYYVIISPCVVEMNIN